ncbi:nuclease-like protein [Bradyrhizobium sp. R2.2-H]|uniref:NERD domain-containing protein n=1 Tax=unclassified Bradyrhizobium TaxID=2631580 RepID=UPI0010EFF827|nr:MULTISPECIES: NERD domain-containing protein [unclassified Bradyrhizobium]TCU64630.1 nuclease-like protein [Bradyrhizobium sp. Y-H1]TCU66819.1 nuclease-like protein [Bradyrhizobium sp. R2.2-H]
MASVEIFIGASIEYASERATLQRAHEFLSAHCIPAVILANLNLGDRQVDLVIAIDRAALVTESKGFTSAVRGGHNGDWEARLASGEWKKFGNPYLQAMGQKLALRDAMRSFAGTDVPYPDAALIFVPAIPAGSTVPPGDFKVSIGGLDNLPGLIGSMKRDGWSLDQWRAFAAHHRLVAAPSVDAASSPELLDAGKLLKAYGGALTRTYGGPASDMVCMSCVHENEALSSDDVLKRSAQDDNMLLMGPSGCGKSLLGYHIALAALARGDVPIIVPAKDFEGSLRDVVNREAALLGARSATAVISATRRLNRRILLVVDGYNECTPAERQRLTRSIAAAVKRYDARAVISSRVSLERGDLLPVRGYAVQIPDDKIKLAIARKAAAGEVSVQTFAELIGTVGSGLEAKMVGQLGQQLSPDTSKYGLFDAYVRERLGSLASDGIRALSRIAGMMMQRISFGLSVRELDRLSDREDVSGALLQALQEANILDKRGDRVSFSHEMFLNVFAAESIVRRAGDDPEAVVAALRLPQHLEMTPFVLGAIDDDSFRRQVLPHVSDARVIRACLAGQCGPDAQRWADERCDEVLARVREEVESVRFEVSDEFMWHVRPKPETVQVWSPQDRAILAAIPQELVAGRRLDELLDLVGKMDARIAEEHLRLLDQAREKKLHLRTGLYAVCYAGVGMRETGLSRICGPISSGGLYDGPKVTASANIHGRLKSNTISPGQVGLLIELDKYSNRDAPAVGTILPELITRWWPRAAHHLRLGLMHAAMMSAPALNDEERRALIAVIEATCLTNGGFDAWGIIDALKSLGALDDDQENYVATAKAEIQTVLADRENPLMWQAANGAWNAQFDHPYDAAYWEAWNDLPEEERKALLFMAAQGAEGHSMFTPSLIAEMASFGDPAAAPILAQWTTLPPKKEVMTQDAIRTFEMAHAALARLRCPLPDRSAEAVSEADHALLACGQILYWLNRDDLPVSTRKSNCAASLAVLSRHDAGVAAAVAGEFFRSDHMFAESARRLPGSKPAVTSFGQFFPDEIAAIYRAALEKPTIQSGYFEFFRVDEMIEKALANLGRYGRARDIPLLRAWTVHPDLGRFAIQAIKEIEEAPTQMKQPVKG